MGPKMIDECLRLNPSGTDCLQYPPTSEQIHTIIIFVLSVVGIASIAAVIIWTIFRHRKKQQKRGKDTEVS
jgi:flagellar basal body-associated protein FliL